MVLDKLMVTGNRRLKDPKTIRMHLSDHIDIDCPDIAISGMAIGADQLFAEMCIERGIPVYAYVPFRGQEKCWTAHAQKRYHEMLQKCEMIIVVSKAPSKRAFFERNAAMVKAATRAVVVWDGKPGGTAHTVGLLERNSVRHSIIENRVGNDGV